MAKKISFPQTEPQKNIYWSSKEKISLQNIVLANLWLHELKKYWKMTLLIALHL